MPGICSVAVTALEFLRGDVLGEEHQSDLFVVDYNNDYLYDFKLSDDRTKLHLEGDLADKIANDNEELEVALGKGFGVITDIKEGPDGYLYLLSYIHSNIYRIVPNLIAIQTYLLSTSKYRIPLIIKDKNANIYSIIWLLFNSANIR